jgi:sugar phosphate isomerase/epimerase
MPAHYFFSNQEQRNFSGAKMIDLYLSLSAYGGVTTREALTVFWNAGVRHVELAIGPKPDVDASIAIREFGQVITYRAHHAFVWGDCHRPFNLARTVDWDYFQHLLTWLATMGIQAYSVHGGSYPIHGDEYKLVCDRFLNNIHRLEQLCQEWGITLGVETMYPALPTSPIQNLLNNSQEVTNFLRDAASVKLVIDLAHLNIWHHDNWEQKLQWLKLPPEKILEIHISDNDGFRDIHSRITSKTWWISAVKFPTGVPIVLESRLQGLSAGEIREECGRVRELLSMS